MMKKILYLLNYASLIAKTFRAGLRSFQAYGRVSRALSKPAAHFYHQLPNKGSFNSPTIPDQAASMRHLLNPRVFGGLFMGSFAATAILYPPAPNLETSGSPPLAVLRNRFFSQTPMINVEQQEQINAALTQLNNDPVWQWTNAEGRERGQQKEQISNAAYRVADDKSLLDFVSKDTSSQKPLETPQQGLIGLQSTTSMQKPLNPSSKKELTEEAALLAFASAPGSKVS
ncbi:hypothetical protein CEUSTIGMA_g1250.t1 [Chlamydomonas eustigma]|uniref:Uncharacterized protein n=1 Tax=Chlamydomonas eustigma TaxID=1157962 RepID=A0A250WSX0_9CHLO|nr:hypothetical protein CEUSTIGMA_g1250.t1 [Chlamydomonas eustigma]|eukprot:GAX73799.1 hypothetical protein CEUSTIGMA_g1250.t1 [Chlamydomonas eustigma]